MSKYDDFFRYYEKTKLNAIIELPDGADANQVKANLNNVVNVVQGKIIYPIDSNDFRNKKFIAITNIPNDECMNYLIDALQNGIVGKGSKNTKAIIVKRPKDVKETTSYSYRENISRINEATLLIANISNYKAIMQALQSMENEGIFGDKSEYMKNVKVAQIPSSSVSKNVLNKIQKALSQNDPQKLEEPIETDEPKEALEEEPPKQPTEVKKGTELSDAEKTKEAPQTTKVKDTPLLKRADKREIPPYRRGSKLTSMDSYFLENFSKGIEDIVYRYYDYFDIKMCQWIEETLLEGIQYNQNNLSVFRIELAVKPSVDEEVAKKVIRNFKEELFKYYKENNQFSIGDFTIIVYPPEVKNTVPLNDTISINIYLGKKKIEKKEDGTEEDNNKKLSHQKVTEPTDLKQAMSQYGIRKSKGLFGGHEL